MSLLLFFCFCEFYPGLRTDAITPYFLVYPWNATQNYNFVLQVIILLSFLSTRWGQSVHLSSEGQHSKGASQVNEENGKRPKK